MPLPGVLWCAAMCPVSHLWERLCDLLNRQASQTGSGSLAKEGFAWQLSIMNPSIDLVLMGMCTAFMHMQLMLLVWH